MPSSAGAIVSISSFGRHIVGGESVDASVAIVPASVEGDDEDDDGADDGSDEEGEYAD
jgi:hypothetical protein